MKKEFNIRNFIHTTIREYLTESVINKTLYHGSNIPNLTTLKPQTNKYHSIPPSIFLSSKKSVAKDYGQYIYKVKLNCNNIKEIDVYGESFHDYLSFEDKIYSGFNDGYDCIIFKNIMDSKEPNTKVPLSDIYVVFDSSKVNVVGNF
jgi:hypothetical protein